MCVTTVLAHSSLTVQDMKKCVKLSFLLQPSVNLFIGLSKLSIKLQREECHGTLASRSQHSIGITVYMWG